ncbi:hypothetical protein TRSC58_06096 [Trypanosoma rangeli SC58]|uniref:Uncharacterized protein n=1 Tax=Trypanosoma rangeli SC58 TaxID=429131 RepID=A0A061IYX3_TRYRA|nr:hypothetical protein TRSC58_06096 [Trypanosoma rangeli SC58]
MPARRSKRRRTPSATSSPVVAHALEARGRRIASTPSGSMPHGTEVLLPPSTSEHCAHVSASHATDEDVIRDLCADERDTRSHHGAGFSAAAAATDNVPMLTAALAKSLYAVEIYFQLEKQRHRGELLFPRDVGDLLLWSVPVAVPLIEGPRVFFIKNKSRLRDVVVIYVNGWTHDEMIVAGASHPVADAGSTEAEAQQEQRWSERVGRAMLAPIRAQQCWARKECGVQLAPMLLPDARSSLEREVFWRNDAPKDSPRRSTS